MKFFCVFVLAGLGVVPLAAQSVFAVRDGGEAPNRSFDVLHYKIEVAFDEAKQTVLGKTTITLVPFLNDLSAVELDAERMEIKTVSLGTIPLSFELHPKKLAIKLDKSYSFGDTLKLSVTYTCSPTRGLYFTQPDSGYPDRPWQIYTQGEDMDNHFWFPCYDFPNDLATSEMIVTVKSSYVAVSNGRLVSVKEDKAARTKTFHWKQEVPHACYLISLAAGEYAVLKGSVGDTPLEYYVYPRHVNDARICFAQTPEMVSWFGKQIGYPYPWAKYAQVLIRDFVMGGMENTSATFLTDQGTVYDARARVDESPTSLIAHELAHQWWGDVVTCRDWRHLWLNESFASYFDPLWHEHALGRDEFAYTMYTCQQAGIQSDKSAGRKPIVSVGSYGSNLYPRGASVLHMLRFVLGDQLFWRAIHHYITKYQHSVVETNDLKVAIEEATGQNLYWFFDQWVFKAGYPIFALSGSWNDSSASLSLKISQQQTVDSLTGVFRTPVDVELTTREGTTTHRINILTKDTVVVIPARSKPSMIIFDKGNWLLKELRWTKTPDEWTEQADYATDPIDRLRALEDLSHEAAPGVVIPVLCRRALVDPFWAVRTTALQLLDKMDSATTEQKTAIEKTLIAALSDAKSAVRVGAVSDLRKYRGPNVVLALQNALKDSSYRVVATTLRSLAKADSANAVPVLLAHLPMPSHRNTIATAALSALAQVDSAQAVDVALRKGRYGEPSEVRWTALGILTRYGKQRNDVRELFTAIAQERPSWIRMHAIQVLGDIGDERVVPLLERIAADANDRSAARAQESVEKITKRLASQK